MATCLSQTLYAPVLKVELYQPFIAKVVQLVEYLLAKQKVVGS